MTTVSEPKPRMRGRRKLAFRLAAIALGLAPFMVFECCLRLGGWGKPEDLGDPYVGFHAVKPLFVNSSDENRFQIPEGRLAFFRYDSFAAQKRPNEYRVFCLGGSTVQGRPYAIETAFSSWLELTLQAADPDTAWEVVNCGGVSYASYRLVPILEEVLGHGADLVIIYTGHNEFLEDRSYGHLKQIPTFIKDLHARLASLRTYGVCQSLWNRAFPPKTPNENTRSVLATEVDALLDYRGGLEKYHRDENWRKSVTGHFEFNLGRLVRLCRNANVPVLLVNPVANLKDCPPFKVEHRGDITTVERQAFDRLWTEIKACDHRNLSPKLALLQKALAIDRRHAAAHFALGDCYEHLHRYRAAKTAYLRAKDEDICPLRILEPMRDSIRRVAQRWSVPLIDAQRLFAERTPDGITGKESLVDHVHPNINGHQLIARALFEQMVQRGWVKPGQAWQDRQKRLYQEHLEALPASYYPQSNARLDGLRRWAAGRAQKAAKPAPKRSAKRST